VNLCWICVASSCPSVCQNICGIAHPKVAEFSVHVTCSRISVLLRHCCKTLCTLGFEDDVIFSHSWSYGMDDTSSMYSAGWKWLTSGNCQAGCMVLCLRLPCIVYCRSVGMHARLQSGSWGNVLASDVSPWAPMLLYTPILQTVKCKYCVPSICYTEVRYMHVLQLLVQFLLS